MAISPPMTHDERVRRIAEAVRRRYEGQRAGQGQGRRPTDGHASIGKAAVSHMVPDPHDPRHRDAKIDASDLVHILSIDPAGRTCTAESGVPFCELVRETLRHGLLPALVPELKTITIGGAVAGCSVESMSFRYGGFHDSCTEYEVVTGTGEVLTASREGDELLFEMIHGSYGTLGMLTRLTFRLVPAEPYVHLRHERHESFAALRARVLALQAAGGADFLDGIAHGPREWVLCVGRFAKQAPYTSRYDWRAIFYKSTRSRAEDYLRTEDYLFRYDTECHWLTRTLPGLELLPVRFLVGRFLLGSTNLLTWSKRLRPVLGLQRRPPVVVDVFIPDGGAEAFTGWYERALDYYPLWIVPYQAPRSYPWIADAQVARAGGTLYWDFAVYGKRNDEPGVDYYRLLQDRTFELGGIKTLISTNQYDEATFWSTYHRGNWDAVKRRTDPGNLFRGLYEKFHYRRA
jgi:FAD/FMN-containing dehydrogenase